MDQSQQGRPIGPPPGPGAAADATAPESEPPTAIATAAELQAWAAADAGQVDGAAEPPDSEPPTALASPAALMALAAEDAREAAQLGEAAAGAPGPAAPEPAPPAFDGVSTVAFPEGFIPPELDPAGAGPPPEPELPVAAAPLLPGSAASASPAAPVTPVAPAASAWVAPEEHGGALATVVGQRPPTAPKARTGLWVVGFVALFVVTLVVAFLLARWFLVAP